MFSTLKYLFASIFLCISLAASYQGIAQEVCTNGIDDDGDNLVDLHDPDCQCRINVRDNLLLNGSFESYDHCPVNYTYDQDHSIAVAWEFGTYTNIIEANFYHNLRCSYDSGLTMAHMPPALPLPDGNAFISIMNTAYLHPISEKDMTKSYVGQCLQSPLKKGEDYTLSFYAGRFRSWDNFIGKIFPFTVAIYGNADCNAVPFGKVNASGNGCPENYPGWVLLGKNVVYSNGEWTQSKVTLIIPFDINVIEIGNDCSILPPINDLTDSTTFLDYHLYYLDDLHLLPTKEFHFEYIHPKTGISCNALPILEAPVTPHASYQWYKDSIAIKGATDSIYQLSDSAEESYYNVIIHTDTNCIVSEPFFTTTSKLNNIKIPADTILCTHNSVVLAPAFEGITYTVNGTIVPVLTINKAGAYNITATDAYGCEKIFHTNVQEQNCLDCNAFIPNAFTPNNDGLNDLFRAKINCNFSEFHFNIFNRWGKKIFDSRDINKGWDGTYLGNKMPGGAYVYLIDYKTSSGNIKTAKGMVVLIK
ncbi:MAG: gliding motility-associated C-terminal domain-containing protein [Panacibacter sp.]